VEVRLAVDATGSQIDFNAKGLYRELVAGGVQVVANDGLLPDRDGELGNRRIDWHLDDFLHFDHRKMLIVDGTIAFVGGSGIEDHYNDERFYDVMCRVTGPVVAQLQALFIAGFRYQGGGLPTDQGELDHLFPVPLDGPESVPTVVLARPGEPPRLGRHRRGSSRRRAADRIVTRIADRAILDGSAAEAGVSVRIVARASRHLYPAAAFRHWYEA
jgi:cardiolipin synthase